MGGPCAVGTSPSTLNAMKTEPSQIKINVNERDSVTGLLYSAAKKNRAGITVILGHGAGALST